MQDLDEFKAAVKAQYDIILVLVNALLALTIVIAMIGIVNTLILSVVERTREIGLTRAVGASRGQVRSAIRWEALLIAAFGLVAALGVGVFFGWVLVHALADEGFRVFALPAAQLLPVAAVTGGADPGGRRAAPRPGPGAAGSCPPSPIPDHMGSAMALDPAALPAASPAGVFVGERHLATLTTCDPTAARTSTPVGFTWDRAVDWSASSPGPRPARCGTWPEAAGPASARWTAGAG